MIDNLSVESLVQAIKQEPEEKDKQCHAVVSRVDNEGVIWVNIAGSTKETPTASTSTEVTKGDSVIVEWRNNKLYIAGNYTNPAAGTIRVNGVEQTAEVAKEAADEALTKADKAGKTAAYFWHTETDTGAGAGAHITQVPQVEFLADPANGGGNTLLTSNGMKIRDGLTDLANFLANEIQLKTLHIKDQSQSGVVSSFIEGSDKAGALVFTNYGGQSPNTRAGSWVYTGINYEDDTTTDSSFVDLRAYSNFGGTFVTAQSEVDEDEIFRVAQLDDTTAAGGVPVNVFTVNKDGSVYIDGKLVADFITERGSFTGDQYVKWASGKIEAWVTQTLGAVSGTAWVSPLKYYNGSISIPSGIFTSSPDFVMLQSTNSQWEIYGSWAVSATQINFRAVTLASTAQTLSVRAYAVQF